MLRSALGLTVLVYLTACDQWHLSINSDGLVFVSVIGDTGEPRHRFRLRTRDASGTVRTLDVPTSGQLKLPPMADGELQVALLPPESCQVSGHNPQTAAVSVGQEIRLAFEVRCT